ncbi:MAG: hypothetical protein ACRC4N_18115, partial [Gammaproteobacteria bacterium]
AFPTKAYQDQKTAIKPFRLGKNLHAVGEIWIRLNKSLDGGMSFDGKNTELFHFLDTSQNLLGYQSIQEGVVSRSCYKLEVVVDINATNGVFLLHGYTDDTFTTPNPNAPLHGKYWAIERGSELYKTQAKYAIENSIEGAINARNTFELFNLHERRALPNDYRVIIHMETFKEWVAMIYTDNTGIPLADPGIVPDGLPMGSLPIYLKYNTHEMLFSTTTGVPKVTVTSFIGEDAGSVVPGLPVEYDLETIQEFSPTYGVFQLKRVGTRIIGDLDGKYLTIQVELGASADKAYITITDPPMDLGDPLDIEAALNRAREAMNNIFVPKFYNYHSRETVPLTPTFARNIAGIRYIKSETIGGVPNGLYVPYNTEYITFTAAPSLVMTVETVTPTGTTAERVAYAGKMKEDGGDFLGIFQLDLPSRPLHNKFVRVDVQEGGLATQSLRITIDDDINRLKNDAITPPIENPNEFLISETT